MIAAILHKFTIFAIVFGMEYQDYFDACNYLESLGKLASPLHNLRKNRPEELDKYVLRTQDLLARVGNPEKELCIIHVAGTSGKGTVVASLHHLLHTSGHIVGSTTSPATTTTLERIKVGELYIDPYEFASIVNELKPVIEDMYLTGEYGRPSYFDCILAISLIYFKRMNCQWVVLEAFMGGRYDATNAIPIAEVSVVTNVGLDHVHLLGNSKQAIAYEKAGIIKQGTYFFTAETDQSLLEFFRQTCEQQDASFHQSTSTQQLILDIAEHLEIPIQNQAVSLPCRFEVVETSPHIILDGAHNVDKVRFTMDKIQASYLGNKLHIIFGTGATKDAYGMLDILASYAHTISLCPITGSKKDSFSISQMYQYLQHRYPDLNVVVFLDASDALQEAVSEATENDTILVTGSLYLTGALRTKWYPVSYILQNCKSF